MNNVGKEIKSLRVSKKISISKITKELNISKNIIDMIESDQIDSSYDVVFYIGHIRSYCNLLEIDSNQFVERFKKQIAFKKNSLNDKLEKPNFNYNSFKLQSFFQVTLGLFIFISFYFLFVKEDNNSREFAKFSQVSFNSLFSKVNESTFFSKDVILLTLLNIVS